MGILTIGLTGRDGGLMKTYVIYAYALNQIQHPEFRNSFVNRTYNMFYGRRCYFWK